MGKKCEFTDANPSIILNSPDVLLRDQAKGVGWRVSGEVVEGSQTHTPIKESLEDR